MDQIAINTKIAEILGLSKEKTLWRFNYVCVSSSGYVSEEEALSEALRLASVGFYPTQPTSYIVKIDPPNFYEDLNESLKIVKYMQERGLKFNLTMDPEDSGWTCWFNKVDHGFCDMEYLEFGKTAAEAICKAFLKWNG